MRSRRVATRVRCTVENFQAVGGWEMRPSFIKYVLATTLVITLPISTLADLTRQAE